MKIATVGKGGSGKTTIAGTLARLLAGDGHKVLAIDGDPNPNLALTLGMARDDADNINYIPPSIMEMKKDADWKTSPSTRASRGPSAPTPWRGQSPSP